MFKIYDEPLAPKEGACLRYMLNRDRRMRARVKDIWRSGIAELGGVFKIYDEPLSPKEGACFKIYGERLSPTAGACLRYMKTYGPSLRRVQVPYIEAQKTIKKYPKKTLS